MMSDEPTLPKLTIILFKRENPKKESSVKSLTIHPSRHWRMPATPCNWSRTLTSLTIRSSRHWRMPATPCNWSRTLTVKA
nr:hypothetical protein [uncultured bacterium]